MLETSSSLVASADLTKVGPDYFTFYTCEVKELLSQNEDLLPSNSELARNRCEVKGQVKLEPSSGSLFSNSVGVGFSNQKQERLNALLQQAVAAFTPEVDEMLDPVLSMRRLQSHVRSRKLISDDMGATANGETEQNNSNKRIKMSSSSSISITTPASPVSYGSCKEGLASKCMDSTCSNVALPGKGVSNVVQKHCAHCSTKTPNPEGKNNACGTTGRNEGHSHLASNTYVDKGDGERDGDLQFLLENDTTLVEEAIMKYSDQLFTTLDHMEKQLEDLLDDVVTTCRPMSRTEKRHLQKLIQKLPPKNLNRVVEIVQRSKLVETQCADEIFVDLEREDNVTLWRLYYYTEAVEKARMLSS